MARAAGDAEGEAVRGGVARIRGSFPLAAGLFDALEYLGCGVTFANVSQRSPFGAVGLASTRFSDALETTFGLTREVMVVFLKEKDIQYAVFQDLPKLLRSIPSTPTQHVCLLIAPDPRLEEKVDDWSRSDFLAVPFGCLDANSHVASADLVRALKRRIYQRNAYDATQPVSGDAFFGRQLLLQELVDAATERHPIGVLGLRKAGKTSLVKQAGAEVRRRHAGLFILRDLEVLPPFGPRLLPTLLGDLVADLNQGFREMGIARSALWALEQRGGDIDVSAFRRALKSTLQREELAGRPVVLALDEIEYLCPASATDDTSGHAQEIGQFLGVLRSLVQETDNFIFLLSGLAPSLIERGMLFGRHNPLFSWARPMYVAPFDFDDSSDLIRTLGRRMGLRWDDEAVERAWMATAGHAFFLRKLAAEAAVKLGLDAPIRVVRRHHVDASLSDWRDATRANVSEIRAHVARYYPKEGKVLDRLCELTVDGPYSSGSITGNETIKRLVQLGLLRRTADGVQVVEFLR